MVYALMTLMAVRELYRHVAKLAGWMPRHNPVRNHVFNAAFAASALIIAAGSWVAFRPVTTAGWFACGSAVIGGTTVPCGWSWVNNTPVLWYLRQLVFLALGTGLIAHALGVL